ncbi:MAG TPA: hypothetical protein VNZ64_11055 [Candidatus Acidoferrum sp.]|jgi:hypothetical protein|nr:hypothetical protein [Candidatus Acidoferrum sp.]
MLKQLDTLIGFAVVMSVVSLLITVVTQAASRTRLDDWSRQFGDIEVHFSKTGLMLVPKSIPFSRRRSLELALASPAGHPCVGRAAEPRSAVLV